MEYILDPTEIHGVIFDLDGVVTETAHIHAIAWKMLFEDILPKLKPKATPYQHPQDYLKYIDGKPRVDGVKSMLQSRSISIPFGHMDDPPDKETICGIGNKKNALFLKLLEEEGVLAFPATVDFIKDLLQAKIKTALISSSKNCIPIIQRAHLENCFQTIVEGTRAEKLKIKGKPAPDIFLRAAQELEISPQHCAIVEDALSGVEAGKRGQFKLVIGIDRANQKKALLDHGATIAVKELSEIYVKRPHALDNFETLNDAFQKKRPAFFLDYDGTLTPIVQTPDLAILSPSMRHILHTLSQNYLTAIISGRDRKDVESKVSLRGIIYAGSHGFDIAGPEGLFYENEEAKAFVDALHDAENALKRSTKHIPGVLIERKKYAIAIHYRLVKENKIPPLTQIIGDIHARFPILRLSQGKKIFELQPSIAWNKGKALLYLLESLDLNPENTLPIYIGDDTTDEDAFLVLKNHGIGIKVGSDDTPTQASLLLKDPGEVEILFKKILKI